MRTVAIPVPDNWETLQNHPLSELVEFGLGIDIEALTSHMTENGYDENEPIILIDSEDGLSLLVLDGRHKRVAAVQAGETPSFRKFVGKHPEAFVAKKVLRQHLDVPQRAYLAAKLVDVGWGGAREGAVNGVTREKAAKLVNVGIGAVADARKALANGAPETCEALRDGTISASDAALVSEAPKDVQAKAVDAVRAGKSRTASKAAKEIQAEEEPEYPNGLIKKAEAAHRAGRITANPRQLEVFAGFDSDLQEELMDSVLSGRQTFGNAVEFQSVPPQTIDEEIAEINRELEDYARRLTDMIKEMPKDVWLDDLGRREGAAQKIRDAAAGVRTAKCQCKCPKCGGAGCAKCHKTGRVPKFALDLMGASP